MIEIPEAHHLALQISNHLAGKKIKAVHAGASPHQFAWYQGDPEKYPELLIGKMIRSARAVGGMVEMILDDVLIVLSEGAYPRLHQQGEKVPAKHQLLLMFDDGTFLSVSVRMYGGILAFRAGMDENQYYVLALQKPSPLTDAFDRAYFDHLVFAESLENLSVKAFLATNQRIPGLGNGILQDILFDAGIHPKRKMVNLSPEQLSAVYGSIKAVLQDMANNGGRDTEMDLFGEMGGYRTRCSKHTVGLPCERCGTLIQKSSYMGGSIYFCPVCQLF